MPTSTPSSSTAPEAFTLPGFEVPAPCAGDPDTLVVWTAAVRIDQRAGTADAVIRIENAGDESCEVQLTDALARRSLVEPTVVVDPGAWAELVVGSRRACARPRPVNAVEVRLNGVDRTVPTAAVACDPTLVEFLPIDRPVTPCADGDLATAPVTGGVAVRNNGFRGCVLGEVSAVDAEPVGSAGAEPTGSPVNALGAGDVVWFATGARPGEECAGATRPVRLGFTSGAAADALIGMCDAFASETGRALYGSPASPLAGRDELPGSARDRTSVLDPFGDPCVTVPVAPPDLVGGEPIISTAVISAADSGRLATWGDPAAGGVVQQLDAPVGGDSFMAVPPAQRLDGTARGAAVVPIGEPPGGPIRIDIADADGSCVRRYLVGPGVDLATAIEAATRWVAG